MDGGREPELHRESRLNFNPSTLYTHIPDSNPELLKQPRHTLTTRLLSTLVPAAYYGSHDQTLDGPHSYMAQELASLFTEGIEVTWLQSCCPVKLGLMLTNASTSEGLDLGWGRL